MQIAKAIISNQQFISIMCYIQERSELDRLLRQSSVNQVNKAKFSTKAKSKLQKQNESKKRRSRKHNKLDRQNRGEHMDLNAQGKKDKRQDTSNRGRQSQWKEQNQMEEVENKQKKHLKIEIKIGPLSKS